MKTPKEVGNILRGLRGERGLKEVAAELGMSWRTLQSYETGVRSPRDTKKEQIAKYYKKTITDIFF